MYVEKTPNECDEPWKIQYPILDDVSDAFSLLVPKIGKAIDRLERDDLVNLKRSFVQKLKDKKQLVPSDPLPDATDDLLEVFSKYWEYLSFEFAEFVVRAIDNEELRRQMEEYKTFVHQSVQVTLEECRNKSINYATPPNRETMLMKVEIDESSFSLQRILDAKGFLVHKLGLNSALFGGWSRGCVTLHFNITVEDMERIAQLRLEEYSEDLHKLDVTRVEVKDRFAHDVPACQISKVRRQEPSVLL